MSTPAEPASRLPLASLLKVTGSYIRWCILRELIKGQPLPAKVVGKAVGISPDAAAKHLGEMRDLGVLIQGYGRLYALAPQWQPPPGTLAIDFGYCLLRFDHPIQ